MLDNNLVNGVSGTNHIANFSPKELSPMKDALCWEFASKHLQNGSAIVLFVVAQATAGSPGRQGFKMVVAANGEMVGTIGGGIMEYKFIEQALSICSDPSARPSAIVQIHNREAGAAEARSGMICSGSQTNIVCPCMPELQALFCDLVEGFAKSLGVVSISPNGLHFNREATLDRRAEYCADSANDWIYRERVGPQFTMHIVGGGHVGTALARVMRALDFYVKVYDQRPDLHLMRENVWAHEKVLTRFEDLTALIPSGPDQFVAVVSTSFKSDEAALKALAEKHFAYIGAMGSTTKIQQIVAALDQNGAGTFKDLRAPIGLPICSHTVEEIAVSIAAQVIEVKNKGDLVG